MFAECGPDAMGIEQVAARAGVGKATIYRRWPGKEELLLDAVGALRTPLPQPQGRSVRADLTALVEALCKEAADPRRGRQFALLLGEGLKYPRLLARYNELVMAPRREVLASVLRRGAGHRRAARGRRRRRRAGPADRGGAGPDRARPGGHRRPLRRQRGQELLRGLAAR